MQLQWGRGLKTPEMRYGPVVRRPNAWLQWGRGLKTPEIKALGEAEERDSCFNGAGALRPRK